jgi:hypothetical protein
MHCCVQLAHCYCACCCGCSDVTVPLPASLQMSDATMVSTHIDNSTIPAMQVQEAPLSLLAVFPCAAVGVRWGGAHRNNAEQMAVGNGFVVVTRVDIISAGCTIMSDATAPCHHCLNPLLPRPLRLPRCSIVRRAAWTS